MSEEEASADQKPSPYQTIVAQRANGKGMSVLQKCGVLVEVFFQETSKGHCNDKGEELSKYCHIDELWLA